MSEFEPGEEQLHDTAWVVVSLLRAWRARDEATFTDLVDLQEDPGKVIALLIGVIDDTAARSYGEQEWAARLRDYSPGGRLPWWWHGD